MATRQVAAANGDAGEQRQELSAAVPQMPGVLVEARGRAGSWPPWQVGGDRPGRALCRPSWELALPAHPPRRRPAPLLGIWKRLKGGGHGVGSGFSQAGRQSEVSKAKPESMRDVPAAL